MLQLNRAKFSANGGCGYVLKPQCMCQGEGLRLGWVPVKLPWILEWWVNRTEGRVSLRLSYQDTGGLEWGTCLLGVVVQ